MKAKEKHDLHPSVLEFKEFVKKHPKVIHDVRSGKKTWQQFYQDWYLAGESDELWNEYKTEEELQETKQEKANSKMLGKVMSLFQNIDPEQMQGQMNNLQNIASNIQELVRIFRGGSAQENETTNTQSQQNPFTFQKD